MKGYNFYIIFPDKKPIFNKLYLSEKYTSYYGRSLYVINVENEAEYLYNKDPELCLKGNPKDDNIRKLYTFGIKIEADNYDNNFNYFSYGIAGLKWLKINITTALKVKETDDNKKEKELSLKEACKEIIDKYKNNPLDIDFASFSTDKIEVTGNVSVIAASNSEVKKACDLKEYRYQGSIVYNKDKNIYYYVLNNSEQECAVILCPFIDNPVLKQGKYIQLGFDAVDVGNYMAREIENNLLHLQCSDYVLTYWKVDTDNCWDHKWQLSALFPSMGLSRRYHHVYRDKEIPYDVWSNIHFGVIGKYCRFSENTLLVGADIAQRISNRDDIKQLSNNMKDTLETIDNTKDIIQLIYNIKDIFKLMIPEGDSESDKSAIKLGFSLYNFYEQTNTIKADKILSYVISDNILMKQ